MNYIADLHIHSPFSRATSPDSSPAGLAAWARIKGIQVIGTGDCTHPGWFKLLKEQLEPAEPGFYRLKDESTIPSILSGILQPETPIRFMLSAEISSIYKRGGSTRKVHNLLYLPDFVTVERLNAKLSGIGNIVSDGRPILGLDSRDLLEIMLDCSPDAFLVPAHIWTPWFSLFGSKSGFDSIEECFGDLSSHIFALETGLSSDPAMNRLISSLDHCALISNSDCHSPSKLGREANLFSTGFDFFSLKNAIKQNNRATFNGTIEFYPEEGKYHFDGHRDCKVCIDPHETRRLNNICPVCGKPLTIGVHHRVLELADRAEPLYPDTAPGFHSLIPLPELLGELLQVGPASKQVAHQYGRVLAQFGSEFNLLLHAELEQIKAFEPLLAKAVKRMRSGKVIRQPGYDGEFGVIKVFAEGELTQLSGQGGLFGDQRHVRVRKKGTSDPFKKPIALTGDKLFSEFSEPSGPNIEQRTAIETAGSRILVAAGPGTGKTFTLVSRLQRLLEQGTDPERIVAITFTTRTAEEMQERLRKCCGSVAERLFVGTFHRFCLEQLRLDNPGLTVVGPESRQRLLKRLFSDRGIAERSKISNAISAHCSCIQPSVTEETKVYVDELVRLNALDLDAIIPVCVQLIQVDFEFKQRVQDRVQHLFVDEFQDLNKSQYDLVQLLAEQATVFAIGDPDQAIYGFRGGDLRHFFRFAEVEGTLLLPLKITYRLPKNIVQAAAGLICRNLICSGLPLTAAASCCDGTIEFYRTLSPASEAELIVRRIEELIGGVDSFSRATGRSGTSDGKHCFSFADFSILFRLGRQAEELAEALSRRGIPYQLVGATPFYMTTPLRPLYHLFQAASGSEEIALWLSLFGSLKGVGTATLDRLESELPLKGNFLALAASMSHAPTTAHALKSLAGIVKNLQQSSTVQGVAAALRTVLPVFNLEPDTADINRLLQLAEGFGTDLNAFSHHLQQYAAATVYDQRAEAVTLMSCHSSKGLEFSVVFLAGLEEGIFPCTLMGTPNVEEERRLFYVGMTRAKQCVILTASGYRGWIGQGTRELSRFIGELPPEFVERPEPTSSRHRKKVESAAQMELFHTE
jgi:DNA helicase II / ATP-dependent DNA helicase PcrA